VIALLAGGALRALALGLGSGRSLVQSRLAERLRQHHAGAVVAICVVACLYVLGAFAIDKWFKAGQKVAHDTILRHRLDSPDASASIVIVDIDERALAALAPQHGRWPWPRDVLASALETINAAGARAVLFNVMMSDADRDHPDADAVMGFVAAGAANTAFPMVRLAAHNDALSRIRTDALTGVRTDNGARTVALLVPVFDSMHPRMGGVNQLPDGDGIVRRYPVWWSEPGFALPSIALQTLAAAGVPTKALPQTISLNWRNKRGGYQRISIADVFSHDPAVQRRVTVMLRGAWVVLGASAPGIAQVKATPVAAITDDNEILATALDDLLHGTWLRIPPAWLTLLVTLAAIAMVGALAIQRASSRLVNNVFVAAQLAMSAVTLLCVSYTNYLVDLSEPIQLLVLVFSAIKLVEVFGQRHWRGLPSYFDPGRDTYQGDVHLLGYLGTELSLREAWMLRAALEKEFGVKNVLCIDNLFGQEHLLRSVSADYACLLVFGATDDALHASIAQAGAASCLHAECHYLPAALDVRSERFTAMLLMWIVTNAYRLIEQKWACGEPTLPQKNAA
jgi:CHASE2 domain-containing sensor protein